MSRRGRAIGALVIGIIVGAILLFLVLRRVEFGRFWEQLVAIEGDKLLLPLAITVVLAFIRPYRWQLIFPLRNRPGFAKAFSALSVGNLINNVLPARSGDVARCFLVDPSARGASLTFATVVVEKVIDLISLLVVLAEARANDRSLRDRRAGSPALPDPDAGEGPGGRFQCRRIGAAGTPRVRRFQSRGRVTR